MHWKDWCWSSNALATWCKELTHWKRPWCWERLKAGGEADNRGWDGWMASLTQWMWVSANSGWWWRAEKPGMLQRVRHDWATEQQWYNPAILLLSSYHREITELVYKKIYTKVLKQNHLKYLRSFAWLFVIVMDKQIVIQTYYGILLNTKLSNY